jgi:hypothetical protein
MKISKVMLASVFLTAAILAVLSGVVTNVLAERNVSQAASASNNASAAEVQQLQEREAQYQQIITQANQQLEQANTELKTLQEQVIELKKQTAPAQNVSANATNSAVAAISAEKAGQIAEEAASLGQVLKKAPELVSFEGKAAYEALFDKGSIYVDAQSGEVLFNGTIPQEISANKAAQVAAEYLKNTDILQVDKITFRNAPMYRVIFKDGTMVYMDITGQITYIQKASPNVVVVEQASSSYSGSAAAPASPAPAAREREHDDGD